jgi:hypothetical protein
LENPSVEAQIREVLIPRKYTRVDVIIDLVFSTAEDILEEEPGQLSNGDDPKSIAGGRESKERHKPVAFNLACVSNIAIFFNVELAKQSRVVYSDLDSGLTITCAVSKEYKNAGRPGYWFAFH